MSFLSKLTALIPFGQKEEISEHFFALNIGNEKLSCCLWTIEKKQLKIYHPISAAYSSLDELTQVTDRLLDESLGPKELDVQKILFGVPGSWLTDGNLKDEKLNTLRKLVKELELTPMAYVENSLALVHFLEKTDGIPPTAILVGFEQHHLSVTVARAGKLDGVKAVSRGENSGSDIEKALLTFTSVETLPSKILLYGQPDQILEKLKDGLLSFSWMSKLPFLHFPKIEILDNDLEIKSICLAGASEIDSNVSFTEEIIKKEVKKTLILDSDKTKSEEEARETVAEDKRGVKEDDNMGFIAGDISSLQQEEQQEEKEQEEDQIVEDDLELQLPPQPQQMDYLPSAAKFSLKRFLPRKFRSMVLLTGLAAACLMILGAYAFLLKAEVKVFVEPKVLEKDAEVIADPAQKTVNEDGRVIPGQLVDTEVSGSIKGEATGKKQIGDAAKGTVKIINNTNEGRGFSKGTILTTAAGLKFTLNNTASVSATPADADSKSVKVVEVTAVEIGADGNLPSGTNLTISNIPTSQIATKAEGNFSGGTSKDVTVVSSDDQKKLLASLASDLRKQAQHKLQEKLPEKKILEEALSENLVKKTFNKNINDQASEFSLNLTAKYKGTAFEDKDLKLIVSKLVTTQVPEGFRLNLEDTETQAEVSKLEKDGKLVFLARFKAKLIPKIDIDKVKNAIRGKSAAEAVAIIKNMENILGSEIKISPKLPPVMQRLPLLGKNIQIEVGLK